MWSDSGLIAAGDDWRGNGVVKVFDLRRMDMSLTERVFEGAAVNQVGVLGFDDFLLLSDSLTVSFLADFSCFLAVFCDF